MARVYLSHSWTNDRETALRLRDSLNRQGHDVFVDTDILHYGTEWGVGLLNALINADGVIAYLTETSLASQHVLTEVGAGLANRRRDPNKFFIPVLKKGLSLPDFVRHLMIAKIDPDDPAKFEKVVTEISDAINTHAKRARVAEGMPRLFISHRHIDEEIARALVECLRVRFYIETQDIRCTSVHPYRLRAGDDTERKLREEVVRAEAVLGLLSPQANQSTYVMFELGAAWGNNVYTCPLLVRGATAEHLPDPIRGRHPLDLRDKADCYQLLDDLEAGTSLERAGGAGVDAQIEQKIDALAQFASAK